MDHAWVLFAAGLLAGGMNAAAGGGTFVSLPAMILAGVPSVAANASSTVALVPGTFASAWAYRRDFRGFQHVSMAAMLAVSVAGGLVGALLLLRTTQAAFDFMVPWLLLLGAVTFAFGRQAGIVLRRRVRIGARALLGCQFVLGIYGGYFGGAVGIMMMAAWSLLGSDDVTTMSAARVMLVSAANAVAVVCFIAAGAVWWPQTLVLMLAAVIGGYGGARIARRLPPQRLRMGITVFNFLLTAAFFWWHGR